MLDVNVIFDCWVSFNICGSKANHVGFSHMAERFIIISCSFFAIVEVVCTFSLLSCWSPSGVATDLDGH